MLLSGAKIQTYFKSSKHFLEILFEKTIDDLKAMCPKCP